MPMILLLMIDGGSKIFADTGLMESDLEFYPLGLRTPRKD